MELALAANDDIYIVSINIFRLIDDSRIYRKIENLNLSSWLSWLVTMPNKLKLKNRRKFSNKSNIKSSRSQNNNRMEVLMIGTKSHPKLKKNLRSLWISLILDVNLYLSSKQVSHWILSIWQTIILLQFKLTIPTYSICWDHMKILLLPYRKAPHLQIWILCLIIWEVHHQQESIFQWITIRAAIKAVLNLILAAVQWKTTQPVLLMETTQVKEILRTSHLTWI